jgi:predicted RNase H-like nuclease (RuvC/YqgF family)
MQSLSNSNDILHRNRKINFAKHKETQKTSNGQSNYEQKVQCLRHHNTQLQTVLQSHNNKNSMLLAQKAEMNTKVSE